MTLTLVSPATLGDLAEIAGEVLPPVWAVMREQIRGGVSFALRDEASRTIVCGGYYPCAAEPGLADGWLMFAKDARMHLREILRHVRWTANQQPYRQLRTTVTTVAGRRIALLVGYRHQVTIEGLEIYICQKSSQDFSAAAIKTPRSSRKNKRPWRSGASSRTSRASKRKSIAPPV